MVRDGLITDSYYANVALSNNGTWYTPEYPLLRGTMRTKLLSKGKLTVKNIATTELHTYDKVRLFNAMIPFGKIEFGRDMILE